MPVEVAAVGQVEFCGFGPCFAWKQMTRETAPGGTKLRFQVARGVNSVLFTIFLNKRGRTQKAIN